MSISFLPKVIGSYYSCSKFTDMNKRHPPKHSFQDFRDLAQPDFPVLTLSYVLYLSILLTLSPWIYCLFSRHCFCSCYKHRWKHSLCPFSVSITLLLILFQTAPVLHSKKAYLISLGCNELLLSQKFHSPLHLCDSTHFILPWNHWFFSACTTRL